MSISTNNEKLAIMELDNVWEPGLPFGGTAVDQAWQQQILHGYPGVLWEAAVVVARAARRTIFRMTNYRYHHPGQRAL